MSQLKSMLQKAISGWLAAHPDRSQAALAKAAGNDPGDLSKIVRGDKASLNMEPAARLAAAMGVTVEEMLAGKSESSGATAVKDIAIGLIDPSPHNPRKLLDKEELAGLAASIAEMGLLQPLVVNRSLTKGRYELIAGHRRLQALKLNKAATALCIVHGASNATARALQIIENLQRVDIPPLDEARALAALQDENKTHWTAAAIGRAIGKSDRFVAQRLAIARNLAPDLQEKLADGTITVEIARVLASAPAKLQKSVAKDQWAMRTPDTLRSRLQDKAIPLSAAAFKVELYDGEWLEEGDKNWFADEAKFNKLQKAVAEARVVKLQKDWPTAALVGGRELSAWVWADDGSPIRIGLYGYGKETGSEKRRKGLSAEDCTALVVIESHKIRTLKNVVKRTVFESKTEKPKPEQRAEPQYRESKLDKEIEALNEQMRDGLAQRPDLAKRLVVYSFLGPVDPVEMDADVRPLAAPWTDLLAGFLPPDNGDGYFAPYDPPDGADDRLWSILLAQDDATIESMLGRFMSAAVRLYAHSQTGGMQRAIAAAIGVELPARLIPEPVVEPDEDGDAVTKSADGAPTEEAAV